MRVNGYEITGNHATTGREYRVIDQSGNCLKSVDHLGKAVAFAESLPPLGDAPADTSAEVEAVAEPEVDSSPEEDNLDDDDDNV